MYRTRWASRGLTVAALGAAGLTLATASPASTIATRDQLAAAPLPAPGQVAFASDRPSLGIPAPATDGSDARIWISASPLTSPLGAPAQLTLEPRGTQDRSPDFSPDGKQVAFASGQPLPFGAQDPLAFAAAIKVIDVRTNAVRTLVAAQSGQDFPAFSPDGSQIAYVAGHTLWVKAAGAGVATPADRLADDVEGKPSWSADGGTISFARAAANGREIWSVGPLPSRPATTEERVVASSSAPTSKGIDNFDPAASPDGAALCYSRTVPDRLVPELAKLDLRTGAISQILTDSDDGTVGGDPAEAQERCAWAPDARTVIFTATSGFPATRQGETSNLHVASVAGEVLANPFLHGLNAPASFDGSADWAPAPPADGGGGNGGGGGGTGTGTGGGAGTTTNPPPPPPPTRLTISGLKMTPRTWVLGSRLPQVVAGDPPTRDPRATPGRLVRGRCVTPTRSNRRARACTRLAVGTTISARSPKAQVTIGFQRVLPGQLLGGRCRKPAAKNPPRARACVRYGATQSLAPIAASRWTGVVHFFGRLSRTKRLVAGASYRVVATARDAAGHRASATGPRFTISKRKFTVRKR
jgi:WD40-like Beta Propeller Repeat